MAATPQDHQDFQTHVPTPTCRSTAEPGRRSRWGSLSLLFSILAGIPAIFVGAHSLRRIKADPALKGHGIAWAGIALGSLSVLAFVPMVYLLSR